MNYFTVRHKKSPAGCTARLQTKYILQGDFNMNYYRNEVTEKKNDDELLTRNGTFQVFVYAYMFVTTIILLSIIAQL